MAEKVTRIMNQIHLRSRQNLQSEEAFTNFALYKNRPKIVQPIDMCSLDRNGRKM